MTDAPSPDPARQMDRMLQLLVEAFDAALAYCDEVDPGPLPSGARASTNLPELLREALEEIAGRDGADRLVEHRPGSWEAQHLLALVGAPGAFT